MASGSPFLQQLPGDFVTSIHRDLRGPGALLRIGLGTRKSSARSA